MKCTGVASLCAFSKGISPFAPLWKPPDVFTIQPWTPMVSHSPEKCTEVLVRQKEFLWDNTSEWLAYCTLPSCTYIITCKYLGSGFLSTLMIRPETVTTVKITLWSSAVHPRSRLLFFWPFLFVCFRFLRWNIKWFWAALELLDPRGPLPSTTPNAEPTEVCQHAWHATFQWSQNFRPFPASFVPVDIDGLLHLFIFME